MSETAILGVVCVIVAELIVQVATWRRVIEIRSELKCFGVYPPLHSLLLRDGTSTHFPFQVPHLDIHRDTILHVGQTLILEFKRLSSLPARILDAVAITALVSTDRSISSPPVPVSC